MADPMIVWDREKLARFKEAYAKVKDRPKDTFMFAGHEFVVGYAKYLIEYLEDRLPK